MNDLCRESDALAEFQRHRTAMFGWARRVVGQDHDAWDVVQDVFLKWVDQCQIVTPGAPRAWLRRVTMNRAIDHLRARRRLHGVDEIEPRSASPSADPLQQEELRGLIAAALACLTDHQRQVLVAKVYDGLTFATIADELELAVPTVKTHYLRALAALRERLPRDLTLTG
jgi:RNA polymerase sigma-70 factor (ECF subfamily)